jgi:hypothetical protein
MDRMDRNEWNAKQTTYGMEWNGIMDAAFVPSQGHLLQSFAPGLQNR